MVASEWQYFTVVSKTSKGSKVICQFCKEDFSVSSVTRLRAHLSCHVEYCKQNTIAACQALAGRATRLCGVRRVPLLIRG